MIRRQFVLLQCQRSTEKMGAVKTAVLLALTAAAINFYFQHKPLLPTKIGGTVDAKFKKVQAAFR